MSELIYPELSYKLMGILFKVHRKLGNVYQEKYYQRAIEVELKNNNLPYKKEVSVNLAYDQNNIGKYFLDFVIDNKICLLYTSPSPRDGLLSRMPSSA